MSKKVFNMQGGKHSAAAYSELEKWAYGSCVASLTSFVVSAGAGMNVNISTGAGLISDTIARRIGTDATETATVPTASASFNRIDSVVAYIDTAVSPTTAVTDNTNNILKFVVVAGTAASTPVAPTGAAILTAIGAGKPYMVLYDLLLPQNAANLSGITLTDRRVVMAAPSIADGIVTTAKLANLAVTKAKLAAAAVDASKIDFTTTGKVWWEELGRATASGGANPTSLSVSFTAKKYLKIMMVQHSGGATLTSVMRFNSDSGANYDYRLQENSSADVATNGQTGLNLGSNTLDGMEGELFMLNEAGFVKPMSGLFNYFSAAAGAIYRNLYGAKYNSNTIVSTVTMLALAGSYKNGSELIIMGHD